ncbi:PREDICTED: kinesin-like protein KIF18B [Calidris pugnax]|uniref:kinesin-like protein KIF18B n=1 Tax=Calidris pugnax TaxID=198806 RepID=UPI00071E1B5E|nr:PREDICTED: kinesin-like protein KIF18B [Calidris pugnax]
MRALGRSSPELCLRAASTMSPPQLPSVPTALDPQPEEGTVTVVVRVRPSVANERERAHPVLRVLDQHVLVFDPEEASGPSGIVPPLRGHKHQGKNQKFVFDRVFEEKATQEEVFQHTTREVLDSVLNGYNCSVFAYGATGAGKTHTMLGSEENPGIMYHTMVELYKRIEARKEEKSCEVLVSYQEVYNEQIHDLLEPKGPLAIREDPEKGVVVQGLSFHQPASAEQLLQMLANGNKNRTQHPTDANKTSSRSHAIFQIYVKQQDRGGGLDRDLQVAKMSLVDLAGSERASVTNAKGERLREGANINRSLLALINVINALADAKSKKTHIPYRDSKLTRLLKDSIGGNCRTIMIAAVSPCALAYEDTYNTLKYASRAKEIKLLLKSNVLSFDCHNSKCVAMCKQLKAEVADLQAKLRAYEDAARPAQSQAPAAAVTSTPVELPRLEEAVLKPCLALEEQMECDGDQEKLEAEWPVQLQLESVEEGPEEVHPSSPKATHQTEVQLEAKTPSFLLQGLSGSQTETLVAAILSVARKQYSLLKAANLLTPAMASEFEELERLVHQKTGGSLGRAPSPTRPSEVDGASPGQNPQWGCDAAASVTTSTALRCSPQLTPLSSSTPTGPSPARKRRRSEGKNASQSATPRSLKTQSKRPRTDGGEAETPQELQSPGSPCLQAVAQAAFVSPLPSSCTSKICPPTVTKGRLPLAMSAAQNCCSHPDTGRKNLNVTFEVCTIGDSPDPAKPVPFGLSEFPIWDNAQSLLNKPDRPIGPKACVSAFPTKTSSIPKSSSVSKAPAQKRKRAVRTTSRSPGQVQSRIPHVPSSSKRCVPPSCITDSKHPLGTLTLKGSQTTTKSLAAPTRQPRKLLC